MTKYAFASTEKFFSYTSMTYFLPFSTLLVMCRKYLFLLNFLFMFLINLRLFSLSFSIYIYGFNYTSFKSNSTVFHSSNFLLLTFSQYFKSFKDSSLAFRKLFSSLLINPNSFYLLLKFLFYAFFPSFIYKINFQYDQEDIFCFFLTPSYSFLLSFRFSSHF